MAGKTSRGVEIVNEHRAQVVEKILADMERDGLRWATPWLPTLSPNNPVSGTVYSGGNRIHLGYVGYMRGFEDNRWCTFNEIQYSGWKLRKGSRSALVERWKQFAVKEENEETGKQEVVGSYLRCVGYWNVFNAAEIEGIPPAPPSPHVNDRTSVIADNLIASSRCPVREDKRYGGMAAYSPAADRILIAPRASFRSDESFTRTLMHEMTHSTGHPSALARECSTKFGSPEYAKEELVAELGSLFLSADLGIQSADYEGEFYENHVSYLQSWMRALANDPSYLFKAAAFADKADVFIMQRYNEHLEKTLELGKDDRSSEKGFSLAGEAKAAKAASEAREAPLAPAAQRDDRCA